MDLDECFRKGMIKKARVDADLIKSLVEMADIKEQAVKTAQVNSQNVSAYVSLAYDSLREVLEAICISKGYKVLSHICIGELLKSLLDDFDYDDFDRLRYVRNGINYYGTKVDFNQGVELIGKIFAMNRKLLNKYLSSFK